MASILRTQHPWETLRLSLRGEDRRAAAPRSEGKCESTAPLATLGLLCTERLSHFAGTGRLSHPQGRWKELRVRGAGNQARRCGRRRKCGFLEGIHRNWKWHLDTQRKGGYPPRPMAGMDQLHPHCRRKPILLPREWGRDPFYTFLPRERNEGLGDVHALMAQWNYGKEQATNRFFVAAGYLLPMPMMQP